MQVYTKRVHLQTKAGHEEGSRVNIAKENYGGRS